MVVKMALVTICRLMKYIKYMKLRVGTYYKGVKPLIHFF